MEEIGSITMIYIPAAVSGNEPALLAREERRPDPRERRKSSLGKREPRIDFVTTRVIARGGNNRN